MPMNRDFELQLQRCIDDELSGKQQRLLLSRLDRIDDGWKALACGLLEDRLLRKTVSHEVPSVSTTASDPTSPTARDAQELQTRRPRFGWYHHRFSSLVLCSAIAFVSGLLIPRLPSSQTPDVPVLAEFGHSADRIYGTPTPLSPTADIAAGPLSGNRRGAPVYQVEFVPEGNSTQQPVQVPVFEGKEEWMDVLAEDPRLFQRAEFGVDQRRNIPETSLLRIPLNDAQDILLLVRDENFGLPVQ